MAENKDKSSLRDRDKQLTIKLRGVEFDHLKRLAFQHQTSISYLGSLAVLNLLIEDQRGQFTMVPEFQNWHPDTYNA